MDVFVPILRRGEFSAECGIATLLLPVRPSVHPSIFNVEVPWSLLFCSLQLHGE